MTIDVVFLPSQLKRTDLVNRTVVIFDVLRATTSMTAAIAVGVERIFLFPNSDAVRAARKNDSTEDVILCGEERCKPPADFQLGNSPGLFLADLHHGKTLMMATTNGTGAILAAGAAAHRLVGAVVNASAVARRINQIGLDTTLLCAGTAGDVAAEDLIGAGAVIDALCRINPETTLGSDRALVARLLFNEVRSDLPAALRSTTGGCNVIDAGLAQDIDFAARLDSLTAVGEVVQIAEQVAPFVRREASC